MKRTIRQNVWGNWRGYEGGRYVREFGNGPEATAEQAAIAWRDADPPIRCADCGADVDPLAVFPGRRCLTCHARIWDRVPLDELPPPDFGAASLNKRRR